MSELPDGPYSVSDMQDYIEYIIKKQKTLPAIPPIHIYINKVNRPNKKWIKCAKS